jgi:hypothetical protein
MLIVVVGSEAVGLVVGGTHAALGAAHLEGAGGDGSEFEADATAEVEVLRRSGNGGQADEKGGENKGAHG